MRRRARVQVGLNQAVEHRLGVGVKLARLLTDRWVVQDLWEVAGQLPGAEEGRPIYVAHQFAQRPFHHPDADEGRLAGEVVRFERPAEAPPARLVQRQQSALSGAGQLGAQLRLLLLVLADECLAQVRADQRAHHAHSAAGIRDVDHWL